MIWLCMQQLQTCVVVFSPPGFAGNRLWAGRFVGQDRSSPVLVFTCWSHLQQAQVALQQASERIPSRAARWVAQGQCHWGFCWPLQLVSCLSTSHPAEAWSGQLSYSSFYQRTMQRYSAIQVQRSKTLPPNSLVCTYSCLAPPCPLPPGKWSRWPQKPSMEHFWFCSWLCRYTLKAGFCTAHCQAVATNSSRKLHMLLGTQRKWRCAMWNRLCWTTTGPMASQKVSMQRHETVSVNFLIPKHVCACNWYTSPCLGFQLNVPKF